MNTKEKQQDARDRDRRLNKLAKNGDVLAIIASLIAFFCFFKTPAELVCTLIFIALSFGACGLYLATSEHRIKFAAGTLFVIGILVFVLLPFATRQWNWKIETGLGINTLLNFSLLCITGAIVALLRDSFGNLLYIEEHDTRSAIVLAVFLIVSALLKVYGKSIEPITGLADLSLVIAGVVIGAMFEKERSKRRRAKQTGNGKR